MLAFLGACVSIYTVDVFRSLDKDECDECGDCGFAIILKILNIGIIFVGMKLVWISYKNEVMKKIDQLGENLNSSTRRIEETVELQGEKMDEAVARIETSASNIEASVNRIEISVNALSESIRLQGEQVNSLAESIRLQGEQTRTTLDRMSSLFQEGQERIITDRRELSNRI